MPIVDIKAARKRWMREFIEYKRTLSCMDCGISDHRVLDFHHRDPRNKHRLPSGKPVKIATWVQTGNTTKWREYVKQCDVVCANCHRIRHYDSGDRPSESNSDGSILEGDSL